MRRLARRSTVTEADTVAVIVNLKEICMEALMEGRRVYVDDLFHLIPVMQGTFDDSRDLYDPKRHKLSVKAQAHKSFVKEMRNWGKVKKVSILQLDPYPFYFIDCASGTTNEQITPNHTGQLKGICLKFNEQALDEGVW